MDAGLTVRPIGSTPQATLSRPEPLPVRQAVATELAPSRSVTAATEGTATRNDPTPLPAPEPATTHDVAIDPQTRELIYRLVDVRTGRVIRQSPDKLMLSMTAYNRAIAKGQSIAEAEAKADLEI
jgi:hypothetical protein